MPHRKLPFEERKESLNFYIHIPLQQRVAVYPSEMEKIDKHIKKLKKQGKKTDRSKFLRKVLMKKLGCKNEHDLILKFPEISEKALELNQEIKKVGLGIYPSQFSKTFLIGVEEEINNEKE